MIKGILSKYSKSGEILVQYAQHVKGVNFKTTHPSFYNPGSVPNSLGCSLGVQYDILNI